MRHRLNHLLASLRSSLRTRGVWATLVRGATRAYRFVVPRQVRPHPFDQQHGVDTSGLLKRRAIASGHPNDAHTTAYYGTHPSIFQGVLLQWQNALKDGPHTLSEYTFVDIGCGKGRVLMLASEFAFCRILGVELSPALVSTARANMDHWQATPHACNEMEVVQADVLEWDPPDVPLLLYLFHPFHAALLQRWLEKLAAATRTRTFPLYFAYVNPAHEELLLGMSEAHLLWTGEISFSSEDRAVDAFGGAAMGCSLYRLESTS